MKLFTLINVVILAAGTALAAPIIITADTTIDAGNISTYENQDVVVQGCVVTVNVPLTLNSLQIQRNAGNVAGVVTHAANLAGGLQLTITGDLVVEGPSGNLVGSRIDASERGFPAASGPGAGSGSTYIAGGGGHAGCGAPSSGGQSGGSAYDAVKTPAQLGSGGGNTSWATGGRGGGCVVLQVAGTFHLDGLLAVNGANGERAYDTQASGAGSGGSVRVTAQAWSGAGSITANGGAGLGCNNGSSGSGAGGRIAVSAGGSTFSGSLVARGDMGGMPAGAGTIFTVIGSQVNGRLEIANGGTAGEVTPALEPDEFDEIIVKTGGRLPLNGAQTFWADLLRVGSGGRVELSAAVEYGTVRIEAGGVIAPVAGDENFHLQAAEDMQIMSGGTLNAKALGYPSSSGPGAGGDAEYYASGGGHGGVGGDSGVGVPGGIAYGAQFLPLEMGSGGGAHTTYYQPGGAGGGLLHVTVDGTLTVDGTICADGGNGQQEYDFCASGGGAGGGICLEVGALAGLGTITANGGSAPLQGGGGGGGRIAIYTCDWQMNPALITATGGTGFQAGHAGTVLHVSPYITISQQPQDQVAFLGTPVMMHIEASTSAGTLEYQWRQDGEDLENDGHFGGVRTDTLHIAAAGYDDNGHYDVWLADDCGNLLSDEVRLIVPRPGDMNCDGSEDFGDINPFVLALTDPASYAQRYPQCRVLQGDCNNDGKIDFGDINPFITILSGR